MFFGFFKIRACKLCYMVSMRKLYAEVLANLHADQSERRPVPRTGPPVRIQPLLLPSGGVLAAHHRSLGTSALRGSGGGRDQQCYTRSKALPPRRDAWSFPRPRPWLWQSTFPSVTTDIISPTLSAYSVFLLLFFVDRTLTWSGVTTCLQRMPSVPDSLAARSVQHSS